MRYSSMLLRTIGLAAIVGSMICGAGCPLVTGQPNRYLDRSGPVAGAPSFAMWEKSPEGSRLEFLAFLPEMGRWEIVGYTTFGMKPMAKEITTMPEGLFLDGKQVPTGPGRRVFVYTKARTFRPVPLTPAEEAALTPEAMATLAEAAVWKEKIKPVLDEEDWTKAKQDTP